LLLRLKTAEQFAAVLDASKQGRAKDAGVWRSAHFVLHVAPMERLQASPETRSRPAASRHAKPSSAMIGVICPKRWAKRAVTRNAIKRQIYAVSSSLATQLPNACIVLRLSHGFASDAFRSASSKALKNAVRSEIQTLLGKLILPEQTAPALSAATS
jgi:ribonuclease P protein component